MHGLDPTTATAAATPEQRLLLASLACERRLTPSLIDRLLPLTVPGVAPSVAHEWLKQFAAQGLVYTGGREHAYGTVPHAEFVYCIAEAVRAPLLRSFDASSLFSLAELHARILHERSVAGFIAACYAGQLSVLERATAALKYQLPRNEIAAFARSTLHQAVCATFDAPWLQRTWGSGTERVVEQVLHNAALLLEPTSELFTWASQQPWPSARPSLLKVLAEHALLRGELALLAHWVPRLETAEQFAWHAASAAVRGAWPEAHKLVHEFDAWSAQRKATLSTPTLLALLALLALHQDTQTGGALAKRWLRHNHGSAAIAGFSANEGCAAVGRSVRRMLQYRSLSESELPRLDAHQVPQHATAWENLILGLIAQQHVAGEVARGAWSTRLQRLGSEWSAAGYPWIARQALGLSQALAGNAVGTSSAFSSTPSSTSAGLLVQHFHAPLDWRHSLSALSEIASRAEPSTSNASKRVVWFVDMAHGLLAKPALELPGADLTWKRQPRVEWSELLEHAAELPEEDTRVLTQLRSLHAQGRPAREVLELLCGHPRVLNGARAALPVEVVQGRVRLYTRAEPGFRNVRLVPRLLEPGVHALAESDTRLLVYRVSPTLAQLSRSLPRELRVPEAHARELESVLSALAPHVELHDSEQASGNLSAAQNTPCLRVSPVAGSWWLEIGVRPFGEGGRFFYPGQGPLRVTREDNGQRLDLERNPEQEVLHAQALCRACPTLLAALDVQAQENAASDGSSSQESYSVALAEEELLGLLVEVRDSGKAHTWEWQNTRPITLRGKVSSASLRGRLRRVKGWYLVTGGIKLDEVTQVALAELVTFPFTRSGRFIRLPSGSVLEVAERMRRVLLTLTQTGRRGAGAQQEPELKVPDSAHAALEPLLEPDNGFEIDASAKQWFEQFQQLQTRTFALPPQLTTTLRPYQLDGYQWLCRANEMDLGVCLADDMGLGKTLQVLALLSQHRRTPVLVVAPTSVCSNWVSEAQRFAPHLRVQEYLGKQRRKLLERCLPQPDAPPDNIDVLVVSYALLQQDRKHLSAISWDTLVLDEAQFIKNPGSIRAKAACALQARQRLALSGTPIENHLGELWSIFHFLQPDLLGSAKLFDVRFLKPIERDADTERASALRALIRPFLLRRTKNQVLSDLPAITHVRHEVQLSKDEAMRYALLRKQVHEKLYDAQTKRENKLQAFAELTRLRRFCCHPRLVFPEASITCSKLQVFMELVEELRANQHRALVFSQFVDFLELVREQLDERGVRYRYLHGGTAKAARQVEIDAFQSGDTELFLISLKAGGFGLNLTAADYVIHLDPWWNPATEAQATDRTHRIGQTKPVTVYRLITKDTIEERVLELHAEKRALADALLGDSSSASSLSWEQLRSLLD